MDYNIDDYKNLLPSIGYDATKEGKFSVQKINKLRLGTCTSKRWWQQKEEVSNGQLGSACFSK